MSPDTPTTDSESKTAPAAEIESKPEPAKENTIEDQPQYPSGLKPLLILLSLYLAVFLVALVSIPQPQPLPPKN